MFIQIMLLMVCGRLYFCRSAFKIISPLLFHGSKDTVSSAPIDRCEFWIDELLISKPGTRKRPKTLHLWFSRTHPNQEHRKPTTEGQVRLYFLITSWIRGHSRTKIDKTDMHSSSWSNLSDFLMSREYQNRKLHGESGALKARKLYRSTVSPTEFCRPRTQISPQNSDRPLKGI
jgi:hypothetical protein